MIAENLENERRISETIQACGLNIFCLSMLERQPVPAGTDLVMIKDRLQRRLWAERVKGKRFKNIVELGVYFGGSIPYLYEACGGDFIVGVDIIQDRPKIRRALARSSLANNHALYFGVDQSDSKALDRIVREHFPDGINLIVDDASHLLAPTRASFETLFPALTAGGLYVIEDYGWGHNSAYQEIGLGAATGENPSLVQIVLELAMLAASNPGWINSININMETITVERGAEPISMPFSIRNNINNWAGLDMEALLALAPSAING